LRCPHSATCTWRCRCREGLAGARTRGLDTWRRCAAGQCCIEAQRWRLLIRGRSSTAMGSFDFGGFCHVLQAGMASAGVVLVLLSWISLTGPVTPCHYESIPTATSDPLSGIGRRACGWDLLQNALVTNIQNPGRGSSLRQSPPVRSQPSTDVACFGDGVWIGERLNQSGKCSSRQPQLQVTSTPFT
jgi:hypothetical protein